MNARLIEKMQVSKASFYRNGGLANPKQFRKMRGNVWTYWRLM